MFVHVHFVMISLLILMNANESLSRDDSLMLNEDEYKGETREICINEVFEAKCLKNEVIVMNSAIYGRMKMGRCLQDPGLHTTFGNDPRFFGCSVDILSFMDSKCSGRNQCEVLVISFQQESPCYADLKTYMEAGYECLTVIDSERSCTITASSSAVHIMRGSSATNLGCGTKSQPWILHAPTGQQVEVRLLDFVRKPKDVDVSRLDNPACRQQYGYILDKSAKKNVTVCGLNYDRKKIIYKSSSNTIELVLINETSLIQGIEEQQKYLIGFIATGCSDLIPPEEAWLRRNNTEATVGCYTSRRTWHLQCLSNQWIGVIGNCTQDLPEVGSVNVYQESSSVNPYTVTIIVAIGFLALIVCAAVICVGFVCLKRHYAISAQKYCHQLDENVKYHGHGSANKQTATMPILTQNEA